MEDKELMIRQTVLLEQIGNKVNAIETKVNAMNDGEVRQLGVRQAVTDERVSRMASIMYGALAAAVSSIIGVVIMWITKK